MFRKLLISFSVALLTAVSILPAVAQCFPWGFGCGFPFGGGFSSAYSTSAFYSSGFSSFGGFGLGGLGCGFGGFGLGGFGLGGLGFGGFW